MRAIGIAAQSVSCIANDSRPPPSLIMIMESPILSSVGAYGRDLPCAWKT